MLKRHEGMAPPSNSTRSNTNIPSTSTSTSTLGTTAPVPKASGSVGTSSRPSVLKNRCCNRPHPPHPQPRKTKQVRLTSMLPPASAPTTAPSTPTLAVALPPGASTAIATKTKEKLRKDRPRVIVLTSSDDDEDGDEDEDEDDAFHGLPRKRPHVAEMKSRERAVKLKDRQTEVVQGQENNGEEPEADLLERLMRENDQLKKECQKYKDRSAREEYNNLREKQRSSRLKERMRDLEIYRDMYSRQQCLSLKEKEKAEELERRLRDMEMNTNVNQKADIDLTELDDLVSCDICTKKMWVPATIVECGHTFCAGCLRDWFHQTYIQHIEAHPEFIAGPEIPLEYLAQQHVPRYRAAIEEMYVAWRVRVPQPGYTCPTCRRVVKTRPVEIYFVKNVVRKVARLVPDGDGDESPGAGPADGGARGHPAVGGIWDGFFPS